MPSVMQTRGDSKDSLGGLLRLDSLQKPKGKEKVLGGPGRKQVYSWGIPRWVRRSNWTQNGHIWVLDPTQSPDHCMTRGKSLSLSGLSLHICRTRLCLRQLPH